MGKKICACCCHIAKRDRYSGKLYPVCNNCCFGKGGIKRMREKTKLDK